MKTHLVILAALAAVALAPPACAASLRPQVVVDSEIVTLGDLFEGAGPLGAKPVFRAPDFGVNGEVPARDAIRAATALGLIGISDSPVASIAVRRASREIDGATQQAMISDAVALQAHLSPESFRLDFSMPVQSVFADPHMAAPVKLASLAYSPASGRFEAILQIGRAGAPDTVTLSGTVTETREVLMLNRSINRGDIISKEDLASQKVDLARVSQDAVVNVTDIVGEEARRAIRAGEALSANDFAPQQLVKRGDLVTVTFRRGGMLLMTRARAQQNGALGDVINALNEQSKRTIQGTVTGPGQILIDGGPGTVAAN